MYIQQNYTKTINTLCVINSSNLIRSNYVRDGNVNTKILIKNQNKNIMIIVAYALCNI